MPGKWNVHAHLRDDEIQGTLIALTYQMLHLKRNQAKIIYRGVMQIELFQTKTKQPQDTNCNADVNIPFVHILWIRCRFDNPKVSETTMRPTET